MYLLKSQHFHSLSCNCDIGFLKKISTLFFTYCRMLKFYKSNQLYLVTPILIIPVTEIDLELPENPIRTFKEVRRNGQLCTLCENFTAQATEYLSKNETQTEIIETLYQACSQWKPFEEQVNRTTFLFFFIFAGIPFHPEVSQWLNI